MTTTPTEASPTDPAHPGAEPGAVRRAGVGRRVGNVLSFLALVLVVGIALAAVIVPRVAGATTLAVLTGSMEPAYPPGTLVVIRPTPPQEIRVGDVITFQLESGKPAVATHRVVEKGFRADGEIQFVTQGDDNPIADQEPVREVQIRGRLWYAIPYLGHVSVLLDGNQRALLTTAVAGGLLAYAGWQVVAGLRDRRSRHDVPPSPGMR